MKRISLLACLLALALSLTPVVGAASATQSEGVFNVRDYGAVGDGVTDDAKAFQAAIDAAPSGDTLYLPHGSYSIQSNLTITKSLDIRGPGTIIVKADIDIHGSYDGTAKSFLTAEANRGDVEVTVGSSSGFAEGDVVMYVGYANDNDWSLDDVRYYCEWHEVDDVPDGTTVTLRSFINGRMEVGALSSNHYPALVKVAPIRVNFYGLTFQMDGDDAQINMRVCADSGLHHCDVTGTSSDTHRLFDVRACRNFTVENCNFHDITDDGYPFWIYTSDGVVIANNNVFNSPRGFLVMWCQNVTATGNVEKYLGSYGFLFSECIGVAATGNTISHIPRTWTSYENQPQNLNAFMLVGGENVTIADNTIYATHGEGAIYLRTSNYDYSEYAGDGTEYDGLYKMPPNRNITVTGNTILEAPETAEASSNHVGPIFGKSFGYNMNISHNTLICGEWTNSSVSGGIVLQGEFRDVIIAENSIESNNRMAIYLKDDASSRYYPASIQVLNNHIRLTGDFDSGDTGIIALQDLEDDGDLGISVISGNVIIGEGQTSDAYMVYVACHTPDWANYRLRVEDNWCKVNNDSSGMRGVFFSLPSATSPAPGAVVVRNNYFDLDGLVYHANVARFVWGTDDLTYNVKKYGAIGDGKTDDTAAIRAAVAAAVDANGIVHVPPGHYLVSGKLVDNQTMHIVGAGPEFSIIDCARYGGVVFDLAQGSIIEDLTIQGAPGSLSATGIGGSDWSLCRVDNCTFRDLAFGIDCGGAWGATLEEISCVAMGGGIRLADFNGGAIRSLSIDGHSAGYGLLLRDSSAFSIENLTTRDNTAAGYDRVRFEGCHSGSLEGWYAEGTQASGSHDLSIGADAGRHADGLTVSEAWIGSEGLAGVAPIAIERAVNITLADFHWQAPDANAIPCYIATAGTGSLDAITVRNWIRDGGDENIPLADDNLAVICEGGFTPSLLATPDAQGNVPLYVTPQPAPANLTRDYNLTAGVDTGRRFTNTGAAGVVTAHLGAATVGQTFSFTRTESHPFRIDPKGAEYFRGHEPGKYLELDSDGSSVTIQCLTPGVWDIVAAYDPTGAVPFAWQP
ncbi:MAG: right-handed parallel beta-helix repeat-containing protein [Sedimentisphaerales bacterium]|nr:right-handed parallel beta-helix repeat-containing protein [Sedimentisphaerales bacterium]